MSESRWVIKTMEKRHVVEAADVHMAAFPDFFLSFLGRGFLRELYRAFAADERSISLVGENPQDGQVFGLVAGTLDPGAFFKALLMKRWWAFGISSLPALIRRPKAAGRVFRALAYRGDSPNDKRRALLSSIAVSPGQQGTGLGSALLREWEKRVRGKGMQGCYLTTDAVGNDGVNRFYVGNGWKIESVSVSPEGRKMNRYVLDWE